MKLVPEGGLPRKMFPPSIGAFHRFIDGVEPAHPAAFQVEAANGKRSGSSISNFSEVWMGKCQIYIYTMNIQYELYIMTNKIYRILQIISNNNIYIVCEYE